MTLLKFTAYTEGSDITYVHVNPEHVAAVTETERRPGNGFYRKAAIIELATGQKHVVYDDNRDVAKQLGGQEE